MIEYTQSLTGQDKNLDIVHLPTMDVGASIEGRIEHHCHSQGACHLFALESPVHPECVRIILVPPVSEAQSGLVDDRTKVAACLSRRSVDRDAKFGALDAFQVVASLADVDVLVSALDALVSSCRNLEAAIAIVALLKLLVIRHAVAWTWSIRL